MTDPRLYFYRAIIRSIYDGDSMTLDIDQGFGDWKHDQKIRLAGIDTPEISGVERPEGLKARDFVRETCPPGTEVLLESIRDTSEKYGRWLGRIHLVDGTCLNDLLIAKGLADVY